jgi:hypothetical protein
MKVCKETLGGKCIYYLPNLFLGFKSGFLLFYKVVLNCRNCTSWFEIILNQNAKVTKELRKQKRIKEGRRKKKEKRN